MHKDFVCTMENYSAIYKNNEFYYLQQHELVQGYVLCQVELVKRRKTDIIEFTHMGYVDKTHRWMKLNKHKLLDYRKILLLPEGKDQEE